MRRRRSRLNSSSSAYRYHRSRLWLDRGRSIFEKEGRSENDPARAAKWFLLPFLLTVKIDGRLTHSGEATQIPGHSLVADRSPAPRRLSFGHTDRLGSTRPSSLNDESGALAIQPFSARVPNLRGKYQSI